MIGRRPTSPPGLAVVGLAGCLLAACGTPQRGPTLADFGPASRPATRAALPQTEIGQVIGHYQAALELEDDPETRVKIQRRLASLELARGEEAQADPARPRVHFDQAISLHRGLLERHPDRADNDRLLYQLAKAYEFDGQGVAAAEALDRLTTAFPDSVHAVEARFRHGELLFTQRRYAEAGRAYRAVVEAQPRGAHYGNALYMLGWSLFKQTRYRDALAPFGALLDVSLRQPDSIERLARVERDRVEDTLRAMSLAFSLLDGVVSLQALAAGRGELPYTHLLYRQLAELYLKQQRFGDSAAVCASYVERHPGSDYAPAFSAQLIDVYQQGEFPSELMPAKESFARRYGIHSDYWRGKDEAMHAQLRPHLHQYLPALAAHYHASAQRLRADAAARPAGSAPASLEREARAALLTAGDWYAEFAQTFPEDPKTPELVFLMAEALSEGGELRRAIAAYERVAYDYRQPERGAEAGYAALVNYQRMLALESLERDAVSSDGAPADGALQRRKNASALRFVEHYPADPRALPVLLHTAQTLLDAGDLERAIELAARVTAWQPVAPPELRQSAWLVQGQGSFELADFGAAETAYAAVLRLMPDPHGERAGTVDRLAASIYRQGETHLAAGEQNAAIDDFLRVAGAAPGSAIAAKAHYDGANGLMASAQWARAEREWQRFRQRYPAHELAASVPTKLAHIHQQRGQWRQAADELTLMAAGAAGEPELRRQSLYAAAELYAKDGATASAIERYGDYVANWPQPFEPATEARYQLSLLHEQRGEQAQRRIWLRELMDGHDRAGARATGRSRYLAAQAATVFAEDAYRDFRAAALTLPLRRSFKVKKRLMTDTLAACERVLDYAIAEFVTEASYHMGEVYASLSADLMASERPGELNALELEQYELLLEEQAYPFEEQAIAIHESNLRRSWNGVYDQWVSASITTLATLLPARYGKPDQLVRYSDDIY